MTTPLNLSLVHAARAWAQTATRAHIERAHQLFRVANATSQPMVVLRVLFRSETQQDLASLVESFFNGTPTHAHVNAFLQEVTGARPLPMRSRAAAPLACV